MSCVSLGRPRQWFRFGPQDVWTLFHSYAFDFSVWELWGALLHGGRLVVVPKMVSRSPAEFLALLAEQRVSVLNQTPSAFYELMQADGEKPEVGDRLSLRFIIFGGEALAPARLRGVVPPSCGGYPGAGEHVRHHRDHGARDLPRAATGSRPAQARAARSG